MNKYLADTTVIIEHARGNTKAKDFLLTCSPSISSVTVAELIQGVRNKEELQQVEKIGKALSQLYLTRAISEKALDLLRTFYLSDGILFWDALIAATAIEHNLILVTKNIKHFRFIKELKLLQQEEAFLMSDA